MIRSFFRTLDWCWFGTKHPCNLCGKPFNLLERIGLQHTVFRMPEKGKPDHRVCHVRCYRRMVPQ